MPLRVGESKKEEINMKMTMEEVVEKLKYLKNIYEKDTNIFKKEVAALEIAIDKLGEVKVGDFYKDEELYYWIVEEREDTKEYFLESIEFPGERNIDDKEDMKYIGNVERGELIELVRVLNE